jgi:hypothetical protein
VKSFFALQYIPSMRPRTPDPEVVRLLADLKAWCDEKHGRQTEIARILGVNRQRISDWFAHRTLPSLGTGLKIQTFLRTQKDQRRKRIEGEP